MRGCGVGDMFDKRLKIHLSLESKLAILLESIEGTINYVNVTAEWGCDPVILATGIHLNTLILSK